MIPRLQMQSWGMESDSDTVEICYSTFAGELYDKFCAVAHPRQQVPSWDQLWEAEDDTSKRFVQAWMDVATHSIESLTNLHQEGEE